MTLVCTALPFCAAARASPASSAFSPRSSSSIASSSLSPSPASSAFSFASFIFLYSSSQSTHSISFVSGCTSYFATAWPSAVDSTASSLVSPRFVHVLPAPTVPASSVETEVPDVFHFRTLALRVERMIWAYSSVLSFPTPTPAGAIDVRCVARREEGEKPPMLEMEAEGVCIGFRLDPSNGVRRSVGGETGRSFVGNCAVLPSTADLGQGVPRAACSVDTLILLERSRVLVEPIAGDAADVVKGKRGAKAEEAIEDVLRSGGGEMLMPCSFSELLCRDGRRDGVRDVFGELREERDEGDEAGEGARVARGVFGTRTSGGEVEGPKPWMLGRLIGSPENDAG